jgi:hypothetical protein
MPSIKSLETLSEFLKQRGTEDEDEKTHRDSVCRSDKEKTPKCN